MEASNSMRALDTTKERCAPGDWHLDMLRSIRHELHMPTCRKTMRVAACGSIIEKDRVITPVVECGIPRDDYSKVHRSK